MSKAAVAVGTAALLAAPAISVTPAQASSHDCNIYGPEYVSEVVDCAISILERAIGW
jgi:hypothetical protein